MAGAEAVRFSWRMPPQGQHPSVAPVLPASGRRDTMRVLHIRARTAMKKLKKLGWHTQLEEVRFKLRKIRYWLTAKALAPGPLLTVSLPCLPQCLPGTDVLRNEFGRRRCGMSLHADGIGKGAPMRPRAREQLSAPVLSAQSSPPR